MDRYAVIGNPIEHSLSPFIHNEFAKQTQQSLSYEKILAPLDQLAETVQQFMQDGGKGVNVTLPFKEQAFALANKKSDLANQAGASNTLVFNKGEIFADNTDGTGLVQDLTNNHHYCVRQKRVLILGAGGAARGILGPLLSLAPDKLIIANRTASKAEELATLFSDLGQVSGVGFDELNDEPFDLMINATSAGLTGNALQLSPQLLSEDSCCYDLMFGSQTTPFLDWAKANNAALCLDGLGMLVEQAAAAFYLWRGVYPDTKSVIAACKITATKQN